MKKKYGLSTQDSRNKERLMMNIMRLDRELEIININTLKLTAGRYKGGRKKVSNNRPNSRYSTYY